MKIKITGKYLNGKPFEARVEEDNMESFREAVKDAKDNGSGVDLKTLLEKPDDVPVVIGETEIDVKKALTLIARKAAISDEEIAEIMDKSTILK